MRIAILTFHRIHNCGTMVQAWALRTVLERMGHTVEFPDCGLMNAPPRFRPLFLKKGNLITTILGVVNRFLLNIGSLGIEDLSRARFRAFRKRFLPERRCTPQDFTSLYDCVIVGSDQVWSPEQMREAAPLFLGDAIPQSVPMIAYAASAGNGLLGSADLMRLLRALPRFSAVSVREEHLRRQLVEAGYSAVRLVADPSLLLAVKDYKAIAAPFRLPGKTLYVYAIWVLPSFMRMARALAKRLNARLVFTPAYGFSRFRAPRGLTYGLSPDRFVAYMMQADYVFAHSFHGTALSVLFNKPFLSFGDMKPDQPISRAEAFLTQIGLHDRFVNEELPLDELERRLLAPIPTTHDKAINNLRQEGMDFLRTALRAAEANATAGTTYA